MKYFPKLVMALGVIIFSIFFIATNSFGQGPSDPGFPSDPGGDPDAPIDGGVGLLLVAGVLYGIKKVREERKKLLSS